MDKQLSKEETLMLFIDEAENDASCWTEETIHKAMDVYARNECIAFAEWIKSKGSYIIPHSQLWRYIDDTGAWELTTEQLYEIYQQSK